ncbi:Sugar (and other) transporter-like protein 14 [Elsinoe fawcettii]|nr:Sugar (and other) transporter-like protein 14 [Elsinoe fawcettii]
MDKSPTLSTRADLVEDVSQADMATKETVLQCLKNNPKVVFYSVGACASAMLWGFDIGVNSITIALPGFKLDFGYQYQGQLLVSATWNALWTAMSSLGMLIGGIICGFISDRFGRRVGFGSGSMLSIAGVGIQYAANTASVLLVGKIVNGLALGFFLTMAPTYVSEVAPIAIRPTLTAAVNLFINAGQLTAIGIGNTRFPIISSASYKVLFAAQWAFPIFVLIFAVLMPESPWHSLRYGRSDEAEKSLRRLRPGHFDVTNDLSEIAAAIEIERQLHSQQHTTSYVDCFRKSDFRRTRIVCGMFVVQQFTGIAFYAQALYFLGISGLPISLTFKLALGGFGVAMLGNIASWFIMDRIGRRPLLLTGVLLNAALLMSVGIAGCFRTPAALYFIGYAMNFAQLFYAPTIGAVSWAVSAETSSLQMRAKTQSLATATNALSSWVMNFITPYLINNDEADLGGKAAFVWAALSLISLVWVWFEVPEVKDRSFAEIDMLFTGGIATRKFKTTKLDLVDHDEKIRDAE